MVHDKDAVFTTVIERGNDVTAYETRSAGNDDQQSPHFQRMDIALTTFHAFVYHGIPSQATGSWASQMKALVFDGKVRLKEYPKPKPSAGEALVRVRMAGICKTDIEISRGYMDFRGVLGHEFVGIVEESPKAALKGTRVVGEINAACGQCDFCLRGLARHCAYRTVLGIQGRDGAMAEYLCLPEANLVQIPDGLSDEQAVFTEPLAAALEILEQVKIEPDQRVLVIGDGRLGLLISLVLRLTACDLLLVGKHREKLKIFADVGGSVRLLDDLLSVDDLFDVVVEASGSPAGWDLAVQRVRPRGTLILKSTYHGSLDFNPAPLVINEITVVGSRCGLFAPALRLMAQGLVDPTPLITGIFPLDQADRAFDRALEKDAIKVLIRM
jgi:threonine dehydrogenase-like Zn-dependent dehydrogenase